MKVHLAFCPAIIPRPPLGIATLKGYVEGHSPHRVVCFDLNLEWHHQLLHTPGNDPQLTAAAHFLEQGNADFFQQVPFNTHAAHFYRGALHHHATLVRNAEGWLAGQPAPDWLTPMAHRLLADQPDLIGFSVCYAPQVAFSLALARVVRQLSPDTPLAFGGSLTTTEAHFDDFLAHGHYIIANEGERPLLALLDALTNHTPLENVPGLIHRSHGQKVHNDPAAAIRLDNQPFPDFADLAMADYFTPTPVVPILTSRGCFWRRCSFCVHHEIYSDAYRLAPIPRVVEEMAAWVARGVSCFSFADEMMPAKRYRQISREILRRGLKVHWFGLARPTRHFDQETFHIMYEAGCRFLLWGVESACQRILDLIDKGTRTEEVATVLGQATTAGIKNYIFLMVGFPSETRDEFQQTLRFLYNNRASIHNIMSGPFKLEPNSKIALDPARFAITAIRDDPDEKGGLLYEVGQGLRPEGLKALHEVVKGSYFNTFSLFSTWFGLLREHALYYHANPANLPTFYWKWHVPDPDGADWPQTPGLQEYFQDTRPHPPPHPQ